MPSNSKMRVTSANVNPNLRALSRCESGNLPDKIEMKITLSMPKTISSNVSVNSATQPAGLLIQEKSILRKFKAELWCKDFS